MPYTFSMEEEEDNGDDYEPDYDESPDGCVSDEPDPVDRKSWHNRRFGYLPVVYRKCRKRTKEDKIAKRKQVEKRRKRKGYR